MRVKLPIRVKLTGCEKKIKTINSCISKRDRKIPLSTFYFKDDNASNVHNHTVVDIKKGWLVDVDWQFVASWAWNLLSCFKRCDLFPTYFYIFRINRTEFNDRKGFIFKGMSTIYTILMFSVDVETEKNKNCWQFLLFIWKFVKKTLKVSCLTVL